MAVNLDESKYFKFVIVSDKPNPSKKKNNFTEKPSKDKDNMSSTPPPPTNNNENSIDDEKKQNSQVTKEQTIPIPEVKVDEISNNNEGDLTKEQKRGNRSPRLNDLTIQLPSNNSNSQLVASPSDLTGVRAPELAPTSPSQNFFKKIGNIIKHPEKEEVSEQVEDNTTPESPEPIPEAENTRSVEIPKIDNENQKSKLRMNSIAHMKMFITRTSSILVDKLKEEFDNLDKKIYPDIDQNWIEENQREQLLENRDNSSIQKDETTNGISQKNRSTQNVLADVGIALNERKEKLDDIGKKGELLSNSSSAMLEAAARLNKKQEQKSKFWNLF